MSEHVLLKRTLSDDVKKILKEYIYSLKPNDDIKLPSESAIGEKYGVSRVTVRRAMDELEQEGLVIRVHGRGTFVNRAALQIDVNLLQGEEYRTIIEKSGYHADVKVLRVNEEEASDEIKEALNLTTNKKVLLIEQLHYADGHPTILNIDRIPVMYLDAIPSMQEFNDVPFFQLLIKYGNIVVCRGRTEFQAVTKQSSEHETKNFYLMENDALLMSKGILYDQMNRPIDYGMTFYDTRYIRYNIMRTFEG